MPFIYSIVIQPPEREYGAHIGPFIREPLAEATLVAGHGIAGDRKAGRNPRRQINLLSRAWLEDLAPLGYTITPGAFGEQLIVQDLDVAALAPGQQLRLGSQAVIEITMPRTGCVRLEAAQGLSNEAFHGRVGQLARVVRDGRIRPGDPVLLLVPDHPDSLTQGENIMRFTTEILIDLPRDEVVALFDDPDNLYEWQEGLQRIEHLSGEPGHAGARSRLVFALEEGEMAMIETITSRDLPNTMVMTYESEGVFNTVASRFVDEGSQTRWVVEHTFEFSGDMAEMPPEMDEAFAAQAQQTGEAFKAFAESQD